MSSHLLKVRRIELLKKLLSLKNPELTIDDAILGCEQISQRLLNLARTIGPKYEDIQFYNRLRIKSKASITEKTQRKRDDPKRGGSYSFHDMTDLIGFRVVTLYDSQLTDGQEFILAMINAGQLLPQKLFIGGTISEAFREAKYYTQDNEENYRSCHEQIVEALSNTFNEHELGALAASKKLVIEPAQEKLYSSAHLIFDAVSHSDDFCVKIPVEFQLRSAAEDIWAEVNHKQLYKLRDRHVWSEQFEAHYESAQRSSGELKGASRSLSKVMREFSRLAHAADHSLQQFNKTSVDDNADCSFVVSLIFRTSENSPHELISRSIGEYRKSVRELNKISPASPPSVDAVVAYNKCREKLYAVREAIDSVIALKDETINDQDAAEANRTLALRNKNALLQAKVLLNLEFLNLRANAAIEEIVFLGEEFVNMNEAIDGQASTGDMQAYRQKYHKAEFRWLYKELCGFLSLNKMNVRPLAVIYFWKHFISKHFSIDLARENIAKSYQYLQIDRTVPSNSIYHVAIPRFLSSQYLLEVTDLTIQFSGKQSEVHQGIDIGRDIPSLRNSLVAKLEDAIKLSVEAAIELRKEVPRRGDIRLGFQDGESRIELETIRKAIELAKSRLNAVLPRPETELHDKVRALFPELL